MSSVKVSILSAVWNEAKYIEAMIESVRSQNHTNFELLIADDGSTDDTVARVKSIGPDDRIKVIHEGTKLGKVGAFNACFRAATGDVFILLAGDDLLTPGSLETRVRSVKSGGGSWDRRTASFAKLETFSEQEKFDGIISPRGNRGNRSGGTVTMTRSLANEVFPIPEELVSEDIWLAEVVAIRASDIVELPEVVLKYRIHEANSNPRHLAYAAMSRAMHARMKAFDLLLSQERFPLSSTEEQRIKDSITLENLRFGRKPLGVLFNPRTAPVPRLRALFGSSEFLFSVRTRFYKFFSAR